MRPVSASRAMARNPSDFLATPKSSKGGGSYLTQSRSGSGLFDKYGLDVSSPKSEASGTNSQMLESKFSRKRAETDLQLLANRIALLKLEEQKALQKVKETKVRAEEVLE